MIARRLTLASLAVLCALTCGLTVGAVSVGAVTQFGSEGVHSGEFRWPYGVAVDQASSDVYVADRKNWRIDKFDGSGGFLMAWGWQVNEENPAEELQLCTSLCGEGISGSGSGEFAYDEGAQGVAVDNDPLSPSYEDVYVIDRENFRVEKFDSSGKFLLMFGGGVNHATSGDVCVVGETCGGGSEGTANSQFEWAAKGSYIAVGPGGRVYVGDRARVQVFEPSGVWRESISLAGLSATDRVSELAVDATGDIFVKDGGDREGEAPVPGVREFEPDGTEKATQFDVGSTSVEALAVDGSGEVFVGDGSGGFHVLEYGAGGQERASFGSKLMKNAYGMAFADTLGELYVSGFREYEEVPGSFRAEPKVWVLSAPVGSLVESGSVSATAGERGEATLTASIDPEGAETTFRFEYVAEAQYENDGFGAASSTSAVAIGSSFEDQPASVSLTSLVPGETYHCRVVATNSNGTVTGSDQTFTEVPPALVDGPWVTNVAGTSATLAAEIDPLGTSTDYRLEWGTTTSYGHTLSGNVGDGKDHVLVNIHPQDLDSDTIYHYRLVTINEVGTVESVDHMFTTQAAGGEVTLPDGRAWELVSPADKKGGLLSSMIVGRLQVASEGTAIAYQSEGPIMGENPAGDVVEDTILSTRGADGWRAQDIVVPQNLPENSIEVNYNTGYGKYGLFSQDLSSAVVSSGVWTSLSPGGPEATLYLRDNANGSYVPLVSPSNVPPGTEFGHEGAVEIGFRTATPDLSHIIVSSSSALTSEAVPNAFGDNLYELAGGALQLVNILPNGKPTGESHPLYLAASKGGGRSVSNDGRWVGWEWGELFGRFAGGGGGFGNSGVYVRDMVDKRTLRVGGPFALYQTMSSDGSRVFFVEHGELYELDTSTGVQSDLTASHGAGEASAGVKPAVWNVSEDGSYVYFVATGVLANGGVSGGDNLYLLHHTGGEWSTSYVATLSSEDEDTWYGQGFYEPSPPRVSSQVSPDGRYLAFMSERPLTGYDNTDAVSGQPDEEVYLFDAVTGRLACVSCDPTGARPIGVFDGDGVEITADEGGTWKQQDASGEPGIPGMNTGPHWLAGNLRGEQAVEASFEPRYVSDSGRLFFNSPEALVPQDTNGLEDVYEYEPVGVGDCLAGSVTFHEREDGCVGLISSGQSSAESAFAAASENGDDAFFVTTSRLAAVDTDTGYDVYDAHVCSASAPCVTEAVSPPPCTTGDSCKAAPSPQPEVFGPAPSATFSGTGNVVEEAKSVKPKKGTVRHKTKPKKHAKRKKKGTKANRSRSGGTIRKGGR